MSTLTKNYGLEKPEKTDFCDIKVINSNTDIIDAELQNLKNDKADKSEVEELKKSVSDGKKLVANAVTAKGVITATDAAFATIATNIESIEVGVDTTDATATAEQLLNGTTAYGKNGKLLGTMQQQLPMNGNSPVSTSFHCYGNLYTEPNGNNVFLLPPKGYYDGNTFLGIKEAKLNADNIKVGVTIGTEPKALTGTFTADATATADKILSGATAYVNGNKITGTAIEGKKFATGTIYGFGNTSFKKFSQVYLTEDLGEESLRAFTVTCDFVPELIIFTAGYALWNGYFMGFVSDKLSAPMRESGAVVYNGKTINIGRNVCNYVTTIGKNTDIGIWTSGNTTTLDITWYAFG